MAVRIVYVLNNKAPDIVQDAKSWLFRDGTLRILSGPLGAGQTRLLVEIREDFILSVEHVDLAVDGENAPEEPEEAPKKPKRAKKRTKKAS